MLWISLAAVCDCSVCGEYIHLNVWRFLCRVVSSCVILTNAGETSQRLLSLNRCMHSCDVVDGNRFKSDLWLGICYIYLCCEDSVVFFLFERLSGEDTLLPYSNVNRSDCGENRFNDKRRQSVFDIFSFSPFEWHSDNTTKAVHGWSQTGPQQGQKKWRIFCVETARNVSSLVI